MTAFSVVFLLVALLFIVIGIMIFFGKTELIHDYHQENVTDKKGYGKAMGKAVGGIGLSALAGGLISLIFKDEKFIFSAVAVFFIGFALSFYFIFKAQKKYNGGMF